jgi:uncharacterized RDD family membrane protein YckC
MAETTATAYAGESPSERWRSLVTPEGVDLRLRLGEAGERAAAFFLDVAILVVGLGIFSLLAVMVAIATESVVREVMIAIWLLGFFVARNFYFVFFELTPRAATPGKRMLGLRVAARSGGALSPTAIFARNAMRELEVFLPLGFMTQNEGWMSLAALVWSGVFVFFPLFNRDRLRVGDFVAGTWVVHAPRVALASDLAKNGAHIEIVFTDAETNAYGIKELTVLEQVLRRRDEETMAAVASRIRKKLGRARPKGESDEAFLAAYYVALRRRLEGRLLFGRRRRDKYDAP